MLIFSKEGFGSHSNIAEAGKMGKRQKPSSRAMQSRMWRSSSRAGIFKVVEIWEDSLMFAI